jgi:hypothetical protein
MVSTIPVPTQAVDGVCVCGYIACTVVGFMIKKDTVYKNITCLSVGLARSPLADL